MEKVATSSTSLHPNGEADGIFRPRALKAMNAQVLRAQSDEGGKAGLAPSGGSLSGLSRYEHMYIDPVFT